MNAAAGAIAALTALALLASIVGCASEPRAVAPVNEYQPQVTNPLSGVFASSRAGLEIQWWTVTDQQNVLARALAPYAEASTPLPASVRANWRRNGFRMVRVPVEDMHALLTSLPIEDKVNQIWLGQSPSWAVAAPGAPWRGERSLLIDGETIRLGAGQLRLLVRAWISPTEGAPTLHTDLAIQYLDSSLSAPSRTPFERTTLRGPEIDGMIFRTLTAPMELSGEYAYCIVSEDPDVDWASMLSTGEDDEARDENAPARETPTLPERAPSPFPERTPDDEAPTHGPQPPGIPLLADALLSRIELLPTRRRARSIVILAPVVPDTFQLRPTAAIPARISTPH